MYLHGSICLLSALCTGTKSFFTESNAPYFPKNSSPCLLSYTNKRRAFEKMHEYLRCIGAAHHFLFRISSKLTMNIKLRGEGTLNFAALKGNQSYSVIINVRKRFCVDTDTNRLFMPRSIESKLLNNPHFQ